MKRATLFWLATLLFGFCPLTKAQKPSTTSNAINFKVSPKRVEGSAFMDSGITDDSGYNLEFTFSQHPTNPQFSITVSFWREKDLMNPQVTDAKNIDWNKMDVMRFAVSTKDPTVIGGSYANPADYTMETSFTRNYTGWKTIKIFLNDALFTCFDQPKVPDEVEDLNVKYYIRCKVTYNNGTKSATAVPYITRSYHQEHSKPAPMEDLGTVDLRPLFEEEKEQEEHQHKWTTKWKTWFIPQDMKWEETYQVPPGPHKHVMHYFVEGGIQKDQRERDINNLPQQFTFKEEEQKLTFERKIEERFVSQTPVSRGLWAVLCSEDARQHGFQPNDTTRADGMNLEEAQRLVEQMNAKSKAKKERWAYSISTQEELDTLNLPFEDSEDGTNEVLTPEGCLYVTAASTTSTTTHIVRYSYILKYNSYYKCVNGDCTAKTVPFVHRHRYNDRKRAERQWKRIQEEAAFENNNHPVEPEDLTRYREKEVSYYVVRYVTWHECSAPDCKQKEPSELYSFLFTNYTLAKRFFSNARNTSDPERLKMMAKGETIDGPLVPSQREISKEEKERAKQEMQQKKEREKNNPEGHTHDFKLVENASVKIEHDDDGNLLYIVEVTRKNVCRDSACHYVEQLPKRTERFTTSREANEFRRSFMH